LRLRVIQVKVLLVSLIVIVFKVIKFDSIFTCGFDLRLDSSIFKCIIPVKVFNTIVLVKTVTNLIFNLISVFINRGLLAHLR